jgi:hypothetical protein
MANAAETSWLQEKDGPVLAAAIRLGCDARDLLAAPLGRVHPGLSTRSAPKHR